jgi:hypothetical protein
MKHVSLSRAVMHPLTALPGPCGGKPGAFTEQKIESFSPYQTPKDPNPMPCREMTPKVRYKGHLKKLE